LKTIAVIAAIRREVQPGLSRLGMVRRGHGLWEGRFAGARLVAQVCGIGGDRAADAADGLIKSHRPDALVSVGFSGGLSQQLKPGDVVRVGLIMKASGVCYRLSDSAAPEADRVHLPAKEEVPGALLTADQLIEGVSDKSRLLKLTGCPVVDMESYWIAEACAHAGTPMVSIRAVSDPHDFALPAEAGAWINPDGEVRPLGLAGSIAKRPWRIATLITLGKHAKSAGDGLADALVKKVEELAG
jgi:nucleoside phosphorylase